MPKIIIKIDTDPIIEYTLINATPFFLEWLRATPVVAFLFLGRQFMADKSKKRVTFYIDGFNFYYGIKRSASVSKKWGNAYWIDVVKLCEGFLGTDEILQKVIYFTASPLSTGKNARQSAFLNANKAINKNKFEVVRGKYLEKNYECPYCGGHISRPEEKKTDVNISVRMIQDCIHKSTDSIILITADTDLLPPLELIRKDFPKVKLKVMFPPSNHSYDISNTLLGWKSKVVLMKNSYKRFENAMMPDDVVDGTKTYSIPTEWKKKQYITK